ncbi:hypothetical protein BYT27DRAFT_7333502 [Phlegmacium glaucopus]|nr:hypothetical protein BYT27DRAFT_7333502 [Phlegmacium glaucopus]
MDPSIWLYLFAMNQQPPPPLLVQQYMWALQMQHFYGWQGPPYQHMGQQEYQYPSNSGAIRHHHHGSLRMTEAPTRYNPLRESSGMIASDHSTGTHPVNARMGADSSGAGKTRGQRRGEDLSGYKIPVMESRSVTAGGSNTPAVIPVPAPAPPIASTSAASMPTPASTSTPASMSTPASATPATAERRRRGYGDNPKTNVRKRPVYDDDSDVHRVSSGSETD